MSDRLHLVYDRVGKNGMIALTAYDGEDVLAVEKLDILKPKKRAEFIDCLTSKHAWIDREVLDRELIEIAADVSKPPAVEPAIVPNSNTGDAAELLAKLDPQVAADAETMLTSPDLFKLVLADIAALGVAGERALAATVYLVGVSRLLARPLACIVQGPSSSGKSYVIEKTAMLFPPESVVHATQMTPQALFHMPPGNLEHRFVVAGERSRAENDDRAEATRALREMISAGRLVKLMPMKLDGEITTVSIEQNGPIAFIESTTLSKIFDEDLNRSILINTDERSDQTREIITTLATRYAGGSDTDVSAIVNKHHAAQRLLQSYSVVVPYAERLGELFADQRVEARRAFPQLISMIQASAHLHQRQRSLDGDGRLIADADDYKLAAFLLNDPFARQLGGRLSPAVARYLERLKTRVGTNPFTANQASQGDSASSSSIYGWIGELYSAGFVEQITENRGRSPATWRLTDLDVDETTTAILPTVKQVCGE